MPRRLVADTRDGLHRAALLDGRQLADLAVDLENVPVLPGSIWRTRIDRLVPGVGAFCSLDGERSGLLRGPDAAGRSSGETLPVQIVSRRSEGKADIVSSEIRLVGRAFIYLAGTTRVVASHRARAAGLPEGMIQALQQAGLGGILRNAASGSDARTVLEEAEMLAAKWRAMAADLPEKIGMLAQGPGAAARLGTDYADAMAVEGDFEAHGIAEAFEALRQPKVRLPGGGTVLIERTAALTAVDVNAAAAGTSRSVNSEAVAAIARHLRLRNLSGLVMIDWVPPDGHDAVLPMLRKALADDPASCRIAGVTPSGLTELTRTRRDVPLAEALELAARAPT